MLFSSSHYVSQAQIDEGEVEVRPGGGRDKGLVMSRSLQNTEANMASIRDVTLYKPGNDSSKLFLD